jgi:hypothetical protein
LTQEAQQEIDSSDTVKQNATQRYLRFNFRLKCCIQLRSQDSDLPMKVVWTNWTSVFSSTQVKTFGSFIIKAPPRPELLLVFAQNQILCYLFHVKLVCQW